MNRRIGFLSPLEILGYEERGHYTSTGQAYVTIHYHVACWCDSDYIQIPKSQSKYHWPICPGNTPSGLPESPRGKGLVKRFSSLQNRGIPMDKYYALNLKKVALYAALAGTVHKYRGAPIPLSNATTVAIAICSTILSMTGKWGTILGCIPAGFLTGYLGANLAQQVKLGISC
jgi:hypothetical protein